MVLSTREGEGRGRRSGERVYGPVASRRLGRSLGVDLVPFKVCPYDCVYCQLGRTERLSASREPFFPVEDLVPEVVRMLEGGPLPDAITLAGSGEPTLHSQLGEIVAALQRATSVPVALLTNGALFGDPKVREEAARADVVLPSLDAGDEETFRRVNRPHGSLSLEGVVAGLEAFRREYRGPVWLEVMVVGGANDAEDHLRRLAGAARRVRPDRIHINTPVRPSALGADAAVPPERLERVRELFGREALVVAEAPGGAGGEREVSGALETRLLALLRRRPCTVQGAASGLSAPPNAVVKALGALGARGEVRCERRGGELFYAARRREVGPWSG